MINRTMRWFDYIFEFVIIFSSLYFTFELEDYGEYLNNREKEEIYLLSMYDDFQKDIIQLDRRIKEFHDQLAYLEKMPRYLDNYGEYQDSVGFVCNYYLHYTFLYNPVNSTFESLKSGGDIKLVSNDNFKILLSELDKSYRSTIISGNNLLTLTKGNSWQDFFLHHIDQETFGQISDDPFFEVKFKNLIASYARLSESYYFFMQGTMEKTKEIVKALEAEMQARDIEYQEGDELQENSLLDHLGDE